MTADGSYDAGISALAQGNTPSAIAALVTAHDLAPRDSEIATALSSAREQAESLIHAEDPWPVSATELGGTLVLVNLVLAALIGMRSSRSAIVTCAGIVLVVFAALLTRAVMTPAYAVVAKADAATHVVTDETSLTRFAVHVGDELPIESRQGGWIKVRGPDGTRAYIAESQIVER